MASGSDSSHSRKEKGLLSPCARRYKSLSSQRALCILENAVYLQAQIVVQAAGAMLLHNEYTAARDKAATGRLRDGRKVPLLPVGF